MLNRLGFGSLEAELFCAAVLLAVLIILLIYEYWQKQLEKKLRDGLRKVSLETTPPTDTDAENYNIYKK